MDSTIRIVPRQVVVLLSGVAALLVAAHLGLLAIEVVTGRDYLFGLVPLFNLDHEHNVPSFFSGGLFLLNAMLFWLVARLPALGGRSRVWLGLAVIFAFLAYDELFGVHERLIQPVRQALDTGGVLYYAWMIAYAVPLAVLVAWFIPTWRSLAPSSRRWLLIAAGLYCLGAIGMEMLGGAWDDRFRYRRGFVWGILVATEEALEMAGLLVLTHALMMLLRPSAGGAPMVIDDTPRAAASV